MKALKSQLASELLADPTARDQLRQFLFTKRLGAATATKADAAPFKIVRSNGEAFKAMVVPKAKAA